ALDWVLSGGGAFAMIDELKGRLVQSHAERTRRIESGDITVVGVTAFTTTEPSPLEEADEGAILVVDPAVEAQIVEALEEWRAGRDARAVARTLDRLRTVAAGSEDTTEATISPAQARGAVGEGDVAVVGLSILSGSHLELVPETVRLLREAGVSAPVVVGGIIPPSDQAKLTEIGVARVYTPKDFRLSEVMAEIADLILAERVSKD